MSANLTDAELLPIWDEQAISNYSFLALAALIVYEYIITIGQEAHLIWNHKWTGATVFFLANRYLNLFAALSLFVQIFYWRTPLSCEAVVMFADGEGIILQQIIAVFSALRVHALSDKRWLLTIATWMMGSLLSFINLYENADTSYAQVLYLGQIPNCAPAELTSWESIHAVTITGHLCAIVADIIPLVITWQKTFEILKSDVQMTLLKLLLRDGTFYFVIFSALNLATLVTRQLNITWTGLSTFTTNISSILISRFMLNLRHVHYAEKRLTGGNAASASSWLGNMVASPLDANVDSWADLDEPVFSSNPLAVDTALDVEVLPLQASDHTAQQSTREDR